MKTLSNKKIGIGGALLIALLMVVSAPAQVTRKELKAAHRKYMYDLQTWTVLHSRGMYASGWVDSSAHDVVMMEYLTWKGYKAVRHDMRFFVRKR